MRDGTLLVVELFSVFLGLLSVCILLFVNQGNKLANRLLAGNIGCTAIYMLTAALTQTDFFINFPHLFRAFYPLYLLIYPLAYLYIRVVYRDETGLKKNDIFHIVPALLTAVQFIPFYRLGTGRKRDYLLHLFTQKKGLTLINEGLLPAEVLSVSVYIIGLLYMTFAVMEIWMTRNQVFFKEQKMLWKPLFNWTIIFIAIHIIIPVCFFVTVLLGTRPESRFFIIILFVGSIFSFLLVFLFTRPQILYGLRPLYPYVEAVAPEAPPKKPIGIETQEKATGKENAVISGHPLLMEYACIVETLLCEKQLFLQPGLTITDLSKQSSIPVHHLSALFNKYWGKGFNDYINICRIDYIKKNINNPSWKNFTVEGKGREAGFNSRITLFKAIKKHTGLSPSEFLEMHQIPL